MSIVIIGRNHLIALHCIGAEGVHIVVTFEDRITGVFSFKHRNMLPVAVRDELDTAVSPGVIGQVGHAFRIQLPAMCTALRTGTTFTISSRINDGIAIITSEQRSAQIETGFPMQLVILIAIYFGEDIFFDPGKLAELVSVITAGNRMYVVGKKDFTHPAGFLSILEDAAIDMSRIANVRKRLNCFYLDLSDKRISEPDRAAAGKLNFPGRSLSAHPAAVNWQLDITNSTVEFPFSKDLAFPSILPTHHISLLSMAMNYAEKNIVHLCVEHYMCEGTVLSS